MKLTPELKARIDAYFASISPEDLFKKAVAVYGFEEVYDLPLPNALIKLNISLSLIGNSEAQDFLTSGQETLPLAA